MAAGHWAVARRSTRTLRVDRYTEFGTSWSPSLGAGWWPAPRLRLRASAGRAFRVPTFTERYYSDPANLARAEVGPETAWAGEGGADLFSPGGWVVQATMFGRADRTSSTGCGRRPADRWQTYNIRDVDTQGVELSACRKRFADGAFVLAEYTGARPRRRGGRPAVEVRARLRPALVGGRGVDSAAGAIQRRAARRVPTPHPLARVPYDYVLLDARVGRRIGSTARTVRGRTQPVRRELSGDRRRRDAGRPSDRPCRFAVGGW